MRVNVDGGTRQPIEWPSREEWAKRQRTVWANDENPHPASATLSDYATRSEIDAVIATLKQIWSDYGRAMKAAQRSAGPLAQQRGETTTDWTQRWLAMSKADQEVGGKAEELRLARRDLNEVIAELRDDRVPWLHHLKPAPPLLTEICARYDEACRVADERWFAEVAATPIDDAAWAAELEARRRIDDSWLFRS